MKKSFIIFIFLLFAFSLPATIINVPADQPTIQLGINVAVDADTILVQPGTYVENINYNGKNITVASLFLTTQDTTYISQTVIDGDQTYPSSTSVVTFENGEDSTAVITGVTITNGFAFYGGGIYCGSSSNPSLVNVKITGNSVEFGGGGGIYCNNSSPSLVNVKISGNSVTDSWGGSGGGIYCGSSSNPSLVNVIITGNSVYDYGGGIFCWDNSNPYLQNVTISGNFAYNNGGGIYCDNSSPSLVNTTISGNTASNNGGGIYCNNNSNLIFDPVDRCNIFLNYANSSGCDLYASDCPTIDVIVDTFTVLQPNDYFAYPIDNFTFDILNAKVEQVDQNLYVSPDGSDDNSGLTLDDPLLTISFALAKILADSTNSLTIHLSNGTYSPSVTGEIFPLYCKSYVSLLGEDEASTILGGEGLRRILVCTNDNNFSIENMTITNGNGGIYCNNSNPSLENVTISGNSATGEFHGTGGGIYCYDSSPSLENVTISDNSATGSYAGGGGGIACSNSSPSLQNVIISDNSAGGGGGIFCNNNSSPSLVNVTILNNSAGGGGGILLWGNSSLSLENVIISGNSADGYDGAGGGIYCYDSNLSLANVTISGNSAEVGGGIYCSSSSPSLENVTISSNSAADYGGGIFCIDNSDPNLINCIMWNDSPEEVYFHGSYDPNSITISYSDIQGGPIGIVTNSNGMIYWLEGNLWDEDPLFTGAGETPYSLLEDSPCIDAGIPDTTGLNLPPWDLIGNLRIWDGDGNGSAIIDMGAYEYGAPPYVDVDDNVIVQTPEVFLQQNYPNPFNPITTINYSLKENSKVTLNIYNIKGQKVKTLVDETLESGNHTVIWNGINDNGKSVSSGIYFYKLKAANFEKTKKMIMIK